MKLKAHREICNLMNVNRQLSTSTGKPSTAIPFKAPEYIYAAAVKTPISDYS